MCAGIFVRVGHGSPGVDHQPWVKERVVEDYALVVCAVLRSFNYSIPEHHLEDFGNAISYSCITSPLPLLASACTTVP